MPFELHRLTILCYASGFTLWLYRAPGPAGAASAVGFFDPAADMIAAGDVILVSGTGGAQLLVAAVDGPRVTVRPLD